MKSKFNYIKTYFTFSKSERNGIMFLMIILIILIVSIKLVPKNSSGIDPADFLLLHNEVDSLFIIKDTASIGKKNKLSSLYNVKTTKKQDVHYNIEINSSDSLALIGLPGIGPVLASRIIKYRNLLGGYYNLDQLKEVYGLKEENFEKAVGHLYLNSSLLKGISIDSAGFKYLARHPYIGRDRAWQIINYRKKKGTGTISPEEIKYGNIFDSLQWQRVKAYLIFENNNHIE